MATYSNFWVILWTWKLNMLPLQCTIISSPGTSFLATKSIFYVVDVTTPCCASLFNIQYLYCKPPTAADTWLETLFCMLRTVYIYKLIRTNQQLCTKFTRLYLHRHHPYMFKWTCHHLQRIQSVTGTKASGSAKFFLHASNLVSDKNLRNEQHFLPTIIAAFFFWSIKT
jgi:hypothetical protein